MARGRTGLVQYSGYVEEEFLQQLKGPQGVRVYKEMSENSATVGASLKAIEDMVRQVDWHVEAADDSPRSQKEKEFLEQALKDMDDSFDELLSEILTMLVFGWSLFEKVYKRRRGPARGRRRASEYSDGRVGWDRIAIRSQDSLDRWRFAEDNTTLGMYQRIDNDSREYFVPMSKAILFRTKITKGNPEGRSLLRNAYRPWYFMKRIQEIEAIGVERDLAGLPVIKVPIEYMDPQAPPEKVRLRNAMLQLLQQIRRNEQEGVLFPAAKDIDGNETGFDIDLLTTGGSRQFDTDAIVNRYEKRIAMVPMTQFLMLGMDRVGSFALSNDMVTMFSASVSSILDNIEETFDRHATRELYALNGVPMQYRARLKHGPVNKPDIETLGNFVMKLTQVQALTPDEGLENHLRTQAKLPEFDSSTAREVADPNAGQQPSPDNEEEPEVEKDWFEKPYADGET